MRWLSEWAELLGRWVNSRSSSCATFYPHSAMEAPPHHHQIWLPVNSKWELAPFKPLQTSWLPQFPKRPKSPENLMSMPMNLFSGNSPSQARETRSRLGTAQVTEGGDQIGSELRWIEKGQDWLLHGKSLAWLTQDRFEESLRSRQSVRPERCESVHERKGWRWRALLPHPAAAARLK